MKQRSLLIILIMIILFSGAHSTLASEEASYKVIKVENSFEVRDYAPYILAETYVTGDFDEAGSNAFRRLFRYISGENRTQEKIDMTAPIGQQKSGDQWVVSFMMPASSNMETLPVPDDPLVTLRQVSTRRMATIRYSGSWSKKNYQKNKIKLDSWVQKEDLSVLGEAIWARYNAPFVPWFMRRNEILVPVLK